MQNDKFVSYLWCFQFLIELSPWLTGGCQGSSSSGHRKEGVVRKRTSDTDFLRSFSLLSRTFQMPEGQATQFPLRARESYWLVTNEERQGQTQQSSTHLCSIRMKQHTNWREGCCWVGETMAGCPFHTWANREEGLLHRFTRSGSERKAPMV